MYTQIIKHFSEPKTVQPFWIELVGTSYCDHTYRIKRTLEASNVYVIEYVLKGTGTLIVEGREYHPSQGDFYLLQPGTPHEYYSSASDPWTKIFANVYGSLCEDIIKDYGLSNTVLLHGCNVEQPLRELIETTYAPNLLESQIMAKCAGKFTEVIAAASAFIRSDTKITGNREVDLMIDYLNANIHRNVSNAELAKLIFRSPDYTIKLFRRMTGFTPYDYQLSRKIEITKRRLCTSSDSISDIAAELGYTDSQHFSKFFKSKCGISPREYRKRYEASEEGHEGFRKNTGLDIEYS